MRSFDSTGGSIHCVTKQIPADNSIRIIHKCFHDKVNPDTLSSIPFCAFISNKSGIAEAQLVYSVDWGKWNSIFLQGNGNCWSGCIPIDELTAGKSLSGEGVKVFLQCRF